MNNLTDVTVTASVLECGKRGRSDRVERHGSGRSGLKQIGFYPFNWKTPKSCAKSCKTVVLDLGDGVPHEALFQFK